MNGEPAYDARTVDHRWLVAMVVIILLASVYRFGALGGFSGMPLGAAKSDAWRAWSIVEVTQTSEGLRIVSDQGDSITLPGGEDAVLLAWDADVVVYVDAGPDAAPGVAGMDDDGSGVVDDRSELGATGSDDQVKTPGDAGYRWPPEDPSRTMRLSQGAMMPVHQGQTITKGTAFEWRGKQRFISQ